MSVERIAALLLGTTKEDREAIAVWLDRHGVDASTLFPKLTSEQAYKRALEKGGTDRLLRIACQHAKYAYLYAKNISQQPCDITRREASRKAEYAQKYALEVDEGPHDVTRKAACHGSARSALLYAYKVDQGPHEMTRRYASRVASAALDYARCIDNGPHDTTRAGVVVDINDRSYAYGYARDIDKGFHPDTWAAVQGSSFEDDYMRHIGVPEGYV